MYSHSPWLQFPPCAYNTDPTQELVHSPHPSKNVPIPSRYPSVQPPPPPLQFGIVGTQNPNNLHIPIPGLIMALPHHFSFSSICSIISFSPARLQISHPGLRSRKRDRKLLTRHLRLMLPLLPLLPPPPPQKKKEPTPSFSSPSLSPFLAPIPVSSLHLPFPKARNAISTYN
ncbi:hypothetical protein K469DRAFT_322032 [Zopfia rhizophila CBS 207.26]|uniref:Uncharacterized protein n=1 Tax=Zopfia rhizophila CBS 207.26 TaxID=1314779 RepID=A0A6A6DHR6_9PEZI|nr:hypothetical protein K469DRAFT_322032 [Zopfia rhizophila CBS 207.26]